MQPANLADRKAICWFLETYSDTDEFTNLALRYALRNYDDICSVYCDDVSDPSAVICVQSFRGKQPSWAYAFSTGDESTLSDLLERVAEERKWSSLSNPESSTSHPPKRLQESSVVFSHVDATLADCIGECFTEAELEMDLLAQYVDEEQRCYQDPAYSHRTIEDTLPTGYSLGTLHSSDAVAVARHWPHLGTIGNQDFLAECIERRPQSAVRQTVTGTSASGAIGWAVEFPNGALGVNFTLIEHSRQRGLSDALFRSYAANHYKRWGKDERSPLLKPLPVYTTTLADGDDFGCYEVERHGLKRQRQLVANLYLKFNDHL